MAKVSCWVSAVERQAANSPAMAMAPITGLTRFIAAQTSAWLGATSGLTRLTPDPAVTTSQATVMAAKVAIKSPLIQVLESLAR